MVEHFRLGYANRTLSYHLPASNRAAGEAQRTRLKSLASCATRSRDMSTFNGSLVVPCSILPVKWWKCTAQDQPNLRAGTPDHLYLPGEHRACGTKKPHRLQRHHPVRGADRCLDVLGCGYRNVTASYGVNGFTADHRAAFERHGIKRVYIAYDRDDAGDKAAAKLASI